MSSIDFLDRVRGDLLLSDGTRIEPSLTRGRFLESDLGRTAQINVRNEPWCSYRQRVVLADDKTIYLVFQFRAETLLELRFSWFSEQFEFKPEPFDEESCLKEKAVYDEWLMRALGTPSFLAPWGTVEACYNAKAGSSVVLIKYTKTDDSCSPSSR